MPPPVTARGFWGSADSSPSGVWGEAPDAFLLLRLFTLCKKLDKRYRIFCVYFEFTHQESHLRNEPVSHCVYFEYPQPHHVRLEGFTKQCLRIPLCDTLHRIRCWVRTPILFMVY